ncbi:phosphopantetheine-binding protein [Paenibacillus taichungensis]|uniref:phosphopantetheine-binding protein n=1 Tax=Paenibacillus taichungensis TaxID=484184 RepID=UPI0038D110CB
MDQVEQKVLTIIKSCMELKQEANRIDLSSRLDIDSLSFMKIVARLENEFDFEFEEQYFILTAFPTVHSWIEYVKARTILNPT